MVPVSIKSIHSTHTESPLDFDTTKPETQIVKACRNAFCSLGYFKIWSLRRSLCRQTSQQASLDRLRYSLACEMVLTLQWELSNVIKTNILYIFTANLDLFPLEIMSYHEQLTKH